MSTQRKNIIQDIISGKRPAIKERESANDAAPSTHSYGTIPPRRSSGPAVGKKLMGLAIIIALGLVGWYGISSFGSIVVRVTPRATAITLDSNVIARQNPAGDLPDVGRYEIMKISQQATRDVPTVGDQKVSEKAKGKITVHNSGSGAPQKLIANTRFESKEGKIYRIREAITIPGKTASGPGSVDVTVYADEAGQSYNVGLTEFTIPGLAGSPRFETIRAVSKTEISGGFEGVRRTATAESIQEAEAAIRAETTLALSGQLSGQVPEGFILIDDATTIGFEAQEGDAVSDDGDTYTVLGTASAYGIIFNRGELSKLIASRNLTGYDGNPVLIENLDALEITLLNKENFVPEKTDQIVLNVRGTAQLVWQFDQDKLRSDLAGLSKREYNAVFVAYPAIQRAESDFKPSWRQSFPDDPAKIVIERITP